jgi:hypothetical protein
VTADRIEPWREGAEDDEALAQAMKTAGEALADWMGWHVDRNDYLTARTVILAARATLEAPLKVLLQAVTSSGVEHEDNRMDWLTVQIDRGVWEALEPYRLHPNQFEGDDEDVADAMVAVRRGEPPENTEERLDAEGFCVHGIPGGVGCSECDGQWSYKAARGIAPPPPGSLSPEDAIRKIRGDDS